MGLTNYSREFMHGYSRMVSPLIGLMQSSKVWKWTNKCTKEFKKIKYSLTHASVLKMPHFSKPFEVMTYTSKYASGAVLMQEYQRIAFDSSKFNKADLSCIVSDQEVLASICTKYT